MFIGTSLTPLPNYDTIIGNLEARTYAYNYFFSTQILFEIAKCESNLKHWDDYTGEVTTNINKNGTKDFGMMQINSSHIDEAKSLGLDIMNVADNMTYAKYLYEREGIQPWSASMRCVAKRIEAEKNGSESS